jgi:hypothetical protein
MYWFSVNWTNSLYGFGRSARERPTFWQYPLFVCQEKINRERLSATIAKTKDIGKT